MPIKSIDTFTSLLNTFFPKTSTFHEHPNASIHAEMIKAREAFRSKTTEPLADFLNNFISYYRALNADCETFNFTSSSVPQVFRLELTACYIELVINRLSEEDLKLPFDFKKKEDAKKIILNSFKNIFELGEAEKIVSSYLELVLASQLQSRIDFDCSKIQSAKKIVDQVVAQTVTSLKILSDQTDS